MLALGLNPLDAAKAYGREHIVRVQRGTGLGRPDGRQNAGAYAPDFTG
ncbi:hypothetical protein [Streptomyces sp. NPDC058595]